MQQDAIYVSEVHSDVAQGKGCRVQERKGPHGHGEVLLGEKTGTWTKESGCGQMGKMFGQHSACLPPVSPMLLTDTCRRIRC